MNANEKQSRSSQEDPLEVTDAQQGDPEVTDTQRGDPGPGRGSSHPLGEATAEALWHVAPTLLYGHLYIRAVFAETEPGFYGGGH